MVVGRVLGTEDATPLSCWVAVAPGSSLALDDVVVIERPLPDGTVVTMSGVITQVRARHEGARFDTDVFLIADGTLPAEVAQAAEVTFTRVMPEIFVPPLPGSEVVRATGTARDDALAFSGMTRRLPAGLGRDGEPLYLNVDFLDGTRGAHVSISGVSGVATKTSYASFLLYGLMTTDVLGRDRMNTRALVFNVKGEDLLFLDAPNAHLPEDQRARYGALGLTPGPFPSVRFCAPPRKGDPAAGPDVSSRSDRVDAFWWTLAELAQEELLPFVFADADDERQQYVMVVHNVAAKLKRDGLAVGDGAWRVADRTLRTFDDLVELLSDVLNDDTTVADWAGRAVGQGTINAFLRRLLAARRDLGRIIRADVADRPTRRIGTDGANVTVVDLHQLPDRAQRFVVGVVLRQEFDRKEASGSAKPLLFVVLDELNKYAPREGSSPIKDLVLDVAERGRSLGIILVGAQQTASEVERRVVANCAIRVVGRLDAAEAGRPEYGWLPPALRQRATIAKPGTMIVGQPELPVPLVAEFPFPSWATRPSERGAAADSVIGADGDAAARAARVPDDPFAGIAP